MNNIQYFDLGRIGYSRFLSIQNNVFNEVLAGNTPVILFAEHPAVITLGKHASRDNILVTKEKLIEKAIGVFRIERGGEVTLHSPGQLMAYPIMNMAGIGVKEYVRKLEQSVINMLDKFGIKGEIRKGFPGVWVKNKKISAIGVSVKKSVSSHGITIYVCPDLKEFSLINPCGLAGVEITSIEKETGRKIPLLEAKEMFLECFSKEFGMSPVASKTNLLVQKKPEWLKKKINMNKLGDMKDLLKKHKLNTVCESALCPNREECFCVHKTATVMILGNTCTRNCGFCGVNNSGQGTAIDKDEPVRTAEFVKGLGLKYVVITSVTRDDIPDGGAEHFAETVRLIRRNNPDTKIETLVSDFIEHIGKVINAKPDVISHNVETVPRLYGEVRRKADYGKSLGVLEEIKKYDSNILTKSGIMVGLEETREEVVDVMKDLRNVKCDLLTIGQYLQPNKNRFPVSRFATPEEFEFYRKEGYKMGFSHVESAPYVRSSFLAERAIAPTNSTIVLRGGL